MRFGTDGIRGRAGVELTESVAAALGRAVVRELGAPAVVVGRDTRESGHVLETAVVEGCAAEGVAVHLMGVAPTPAVAFAAERHGWVGIVITASHNPWTDNGIKVFASGGAKLTDAEQVEIERVWHALGTAPAPASLGTVHQADEVMEEYFAHRVGVVGVRGLDGLRVVVDCANGAMSSVAPAVLAAAGADVIATNDGPDGRNINESCGATHTESLVRRVLEERADLGVSFDGDGDRVIAADHEGTIVDGDRVIALAAADLLRRGELEPRTVVVTVMSNAGFHAAMEALGVAVETVPVGDRHVLAAMDRSGAVLGGEQSGHVVFGRHATTGDGLLTGALLAGIVRRSGTTLRDLAAGAMHALPQVLVNARASAPRVAEEMAGEIAAAVGRLGGTGRVLVRASGTEPVVRVMVEAETEELAGAVARDLAAAVERRYAADR